MQVILFVSLLMQVAAAIIAVSYIRKTLHVTWLFIGGALLLMGFRRFLNLTNLDVASSVSEIVAFIISIMMLIGIIAISKIFRQYNENITHIKSLQNIDRAMLTSLSLKGVMNTVIDALNTTLDADAMAIFTVDNGSHLHTCATHNLSDTVEQRVKSESNGFLSWVVENRKPIIIPKINDNEDEEFLRTLRNEGFSSYMGAPITVKGTMPVGVLTLYSKRPRRYTRREMDFIKAISSQVAIALDRAQMVDRMKEMGVESVRALVEAIEIRDPYTRGHSHQVADLAIRLGKAMGLTERELNLIEFAGLLHDVGKIAVPETILQKRAKLNDDEWQVIKKHPEHSAKIVEPVLDLRYITNWILHHHERWDCKGYPDGRSREDIPLQSRILAVCDTYSAMTESRPYRNALTVEETRAEIERVSGTQLDPMVAQVFLDLDLNEENNCHIKLLESAHTQHSHTSSREAGGSGDPQLPH
jgi:HD-GYP domain-containing protein (c-di-GMP phosphodiesterase class II)